MDISKLKLRVPVKLEHLSRQNLTELVRFIGGELLHGENNRFDYLINTNNDPDDFWNKLAIDRNSKYITENVFLNSLELDKLIDFVGSKLNLCVEVTYDNLKKEILYSECLLTHGDSIMTSNGQIGKVSNISFCNRILDKKISNVVDSKVDFLIGPCSLKNQYQNNSRVLSLAIENGYLVNDSFIAWLTEKLNKIDNTENIILKQDTLVFAATGKFEKFTRDSLKLFIEEKGHKLLDKISTNADYLINNDVNSNSSKNTFANSNNIPIISELELIKLIDSNSISDNVTSEKSYNINHILQTDFNIENLIGYYGKYKSSKDKLAKFEIINDISFSDDSINIDFDKTINEYAYCHQDTKIGDFLLLESGKIVMISNFQNFVNPSYNIQVSTHYFHKTTQKTNHRFGIFYNDVEFDVEEQSFRYKEPHYGFYSNDLEQFIQGSYISDTLIYNSFLGFISKNEDGNYIEAGVEVDKQQFNDSFWDTYCEIFDKHSFNGIPKLEDIRFLEREFLIQDDRIKNTFEMNDILTEVEYFYIDRNNKKSVAECIKERLSSTLAVALAYAANNVLLLVRGEQDHLFIILEKDFDSHQLIAKQNSQGKFILVKDEEIDNHKKIENIVDVSFDNGKKYSYNSKISVKVGDFVKVSGKISKIGEVVKIQSGWNDNPFMQEIIEVTSSQKNKDGTKNHELDKSTEHLVIFGGYTIKGNISYEDAYASLPIDLKTEITSILNQNVQIDTKTKNNYFYRLVISDIDKNMKWFLADELDNLLPIDDDILKKYNNLPVNEIVHQLLNNIEDKDYMLDLRNKEVIFYYSVDDKAKIVVEYLEDFYKNAIMYGKSINYDMYRKSLIVAKILYKKYEHKVEKSNVQIIHDKPTYSYDEWTNYYPENFIIDANNLFHTITRLINLIEDENNPFVAFVTNDY